MYGGMLTSGTGTWVPEPFLSHNPTPLQTEWIHTLFFFSYFTSFKLLYFKIPYFDLPNAETF